MRAPSLIVAATAAGMLVLGGATRSNRFDVTGATVSAQALISVNQEISLGRQAQQQVRANTPELNDSQVQSYLNGVMRQLVARAGGPRYPYSISVANYAEVNAFALPGGPVWLHRGAIEAAQNESQLVGVMAHEVAHIAKRHVADQMTKQLIAGGLLGLLGAALGDDRSGRVTESIAGFAAGAYLLKFSRDDEREADREGVRMMRAAGWDPRGLPEFLEQLRTRQGRDPSSVEVFLSSHPAPGDRAQALRAAGVGSGGRRDSTSFQHQKNRLRQMPPAQRMPRRR